MPWNHIWTKPGNSLSKKCKSDLSKSVQKELAQKSNKILEEVIETDNPTKFKKLLKLLDAHEYIDDVDYDRKTVIYIKKDGG